MKKSVTLAEEQIFNINVQMITFFACVIIGLFLSQSQSKYNLLSYKIVPYILCALVYGFIKLTRSIELKEGTISVGINFLGFFLKKESFPVSDIEDIVLYQNNELYFEITINRKNNKKLIVKKIANKNPATAQLKLIEEYIKLAQ